MKKAIKLFWATFIFAVKRNLENRGSVAIRIGQSLSSLLLALFFINIIFAKTQSIGHWTRYEVFLLMGIYQFMTALYQCFFRISVFQLPNLVQTGELDLILLHPVNSQFYISIRHMRPHLLLTALSGLVLIVYSLNQLSLNLGVVNWLLLIVGLLSGTIIFYSLFYLIATLSIWLIQMNALTNLYHMLIEPLSIPLDIIGPKVTFALTFIIPMALIITIPVKLFLNKSPAYYAGLGVIFAAILMLISILFWKFALKHYTSASS